MQITEPVTMLTDYALAAATLFFTISTYNGMHSKNRVTGLLLLLGFLFEAISAFLGGTFHGFAADLQGTTRKALWDLTMLTIGATLAFLAAGVHAAHVQRENGKWILSAVIIAVVGVGIQFTGFRTRQIFNHNDMFHIITLAAMCLFFKGSRTLQDRAYSPR